MNDMKIILLGILILINIGGSLAQEFEEGEVIWEHDFSNGMPSEFQKSAGYLNSGTWGCEWDTGCDDGSQTDTNGAYEPASIQGNYVRILGKSPSSRAVGFPTHLEENSGQYSEWLFEYRVDPEVKTNDKHSDRDTAGFRTSPNWFENHNRPGRCPGVNWKDEGSTIVICDGEGGSVQENSNMDAVNNEYHVKVASTSNETLVKYWQPGNSEPSSWQHQANFNIQGVPAFFASAAFHTNRWNEYRYYRLKEISTNDAPNKPQNPSPMDGEETVGLEPQLSVDVSDPDNDDLDVAFYNAANGSLIGTDNAVISGGTATINAPGFNETGKTYEWYVEASDGKETNRSDTWNFTTEHRPQVNEASATPQEGETVSTNPELSVNVSHLDGREMDVTFFLNGEAFGADQTVNGEGTASIQTNILDANQQYNWSVVVDDRNGYTTESREWGFQTDAGEPSIGIEYGEGVNYGSDKAILDVVLGHSHASTVEFVRLLDENGTVVDEVQGASVGEPVSLIWEGLEQDKKYAWSTEIEHSGETAETLKASFTTFTVGVNLAENVPSADNYKVYRRNSSGTDNPVFDYGKQDYTYVGASAARDIVDGSKILSEGVTYCYVVTAQNIGGESPGSEEVCMDNGLEVIQ